MKNGNFVIGIITAVTFASCGQGPSFVDNNHGAVQRDASTGEADGQAQANNQESPSSPSADAPVDQGGGSTTGGSTPTNGGGGSSGGGGGSNGGGGSTPTNNPTVFKNDPANPDSPTFVIPGVTPDESNQIAQCIRKWGKVPFTGSFTNVKRIKASVSVLGIGNVINDTAQTSTPALVLVDASVNVMGSPTANFLNNNGYYCMKVNVNVLTQFNVKLACNAHLADNTVQVDVNSQTNSSTANIGVNVGSQVTVSRQTPAGQACQ
jgi:hypothetical protein